MPEPPDVFRSDLPAPVSAVVMSLLEKQPLKRPQTPAHLQAALNGIIQKQETAEINPDDSILDLGIDDEMISGAIIVDPDDFAHTEDDLILKPVAREQVESNIARRERFEPPTITVIEPPPHEIIEHSPQIETTAKVNVVRQESPVVMAQSAPADIKTKLFFVLLIIIVAALSLILFDPAMSFRSKAPANSPPEESTTEGSTEAVQPAKPALNDPEGRTSLDSSAGSTQSEQSVGNRPGKTQPPKRARGLKAGYSRQKPVVRTAQRKFKSRVAVRPAKRARVRSRYN